MRAVREHLRALATPQDLTAVVAYAFDRRTRMLPFVFADTRIAPAGVRGVASALLDSGVTRTRVVLQQWSPRFDPAAMRLDGRIPDLFCVSSMSLHGREMDRLIRRANAIPPAHRPLVVAGGPRTNYEPWRVFPTTEDAASSADVAVTGEAYVLCALLEVLLAERARGETLRQAFLRCRDTGRLDGVPGLVYARGAREGVAEELVDTGTQRLLRDLDELPHPVLGFSALEPPSRKRTLAARPLPRERVRRHTPCASLEMTYGCKFRCPYCPIPAYNQHQDRQKSPARIADELRALNETYGIRWFFGADDNFFNRKERTLSIVETLAGATCGDGTPLRKRIRLMTEATLHDTYEMRDHLDLARAGGLRALWLGVEDMTATLVKKGQSVDKTREVFQALWKARILPMAMMMHDDTQPLLTLGSARGLLNQTQLLRSAGAMTFQVLHLGPSQGTKLYNETYESGLAYESVNGQTIEEWMNSGNYVIASRHSRPWQRQMNAVLAYLWFYNPVRLLKALVWPTNRKGWFVDAFWQAVGCAGVLWNVCRTPGWAWRLLRGPIRRTTEVPRPAVRMRSPDGGPAAHDVPAGPDPKTIRRLPAPVPAAPTRAAKTLLTGPLSRMSGEAAAK